MNTSVRIALLAVAAFVGLVEARAEKMYIYPLTKRPVNVSIFAMDEYGNPLAGEPVTVCPFLEDKPGAKWDSITRATGEDGYLRLRGKPAGQFFNIDFRVGDTNYYHTGLECANRPWQDIKEFVVTGVVRKIGNPIKMHLSAVYVRGNGPTGVFYIDMMKGELMPPEGKGSVTDAVLRVSTEMYTDPVSGKAKPGKIRAVLDMLEPGGGFVKTGCFPSCIYSHVREAPADGKYIKSVDCWTTTTNHSMSGSAVCEYEKTAIVFKSIRGKKDDPNVKESFYGLMSRVDLTAFWLESRELEWMVTLQLVTNGRPNDRNLEKFGWQDDAWVYDNVIRINREPVPEALRYE